MTISKFPAQYFPVALRGRRLAYSDVGDANSTHVLLCLPGLLETRATFDSLLSAAQAVPGLRLISLDHCGRGDSDPLPHDSGYAMSVYLQDTAQFVRQVVMRDGAPVPRIEVLGTSMGGILAMYLAQDPQLPIQGLFLNDIGLSLSWMAIYGLYGSMKQGGRMPTAPEMAQQLNVSVGAVEAVQSGTHFDLPYKKDWKGMRFAHLLETFKGSVRWIYAGESAVCTQEQLNEIKRVLPGSPLFLVAGAVHPAPYTDAVCEFVLKTLKPAPVVQKKHLEFTQQEMWAQTTTPGQDQGFWPWLKRRYLGAKAK
jgi:pimeloyl-ACP methyl ester carboxylesterase